MRFYTNVSIVGGKIAVREYSDETGSRDYCTHVIGNGKVLLAFTCALNPGNVEFGRYLELHGDGVHDIAFTVEDC